MKLISMRMLLAAGLMVALAGCGYDYNDSPATKAAYDRLADRPADTLIAAKADCDTCRYLRLTQGSAAGLAAGAYFDVAGKLPLDLLDRTKMSYDPDISFRLVGKVLAADPSRRPVFYVSSFTRFAFRPVYWTEKSAAGLYTRRNRIVQGVADNLLFEGRPLRELTGLLGQPDTVLPERISYRIDDNRGETDPGKASKLDIRFRADSVITEHEIVDPLMGVK